MTPCSVRTFLNVPLHPKGCLALVLKAAIDVSNSVKYGVMQCTERSTKDQEQHDVEMLAVHQEARVVEDGPATALGVRQPGPPRAPLA